MDGFITITDSIKSTLLRNSVFIRAQTKVNKNAQAKKGYNLCLKKCII